MNMYAERLFSDARLTMGWTFSTEHPEQVSQRWKSWAGAGWVRDGVRGWLAGLGAGDVFAGALRWGGSVVSEAAKGPAPESAGDAFQSGVLMGWLSAGVDGGLEPHEIEH